jgi:hypothetical protein
MKKTLSTILSIALAIPVSFVFFPKNASAQQVTISDLMIAKRITRVSCSVTGVAKILFWDNVTTACFLPTDQFPLGLWRMTQNGEMISITTQTVTPPTNGTGNDTPTGVSPLVKQIMTTEGLSETSCGVGASSLFVGGGRLATCFLPTANYPSGIYFVTEDLRIVKRGGNAPVAPPTSNFPTGSGAVPDGGASVSNTSIFLTSNNSFGLSPDMFNSLSSEVRRDGLTLTSCGNSVIMKYGEYSACILPTNRYPSGTWRMR